MNFFLDTSICVDVLRTNGAQKSFELFESFGGENTGYISVITVAELSAGASLSPRHDAVSKTEELLAHVLDCGTHRNYRHGGWKNVCHPFESREKN